MKKIFILMLLSMNLTACGDMNDADFIIGDQHKHVNGVLDPRLKVWMDYWFEFFKSENIGVKYDSTEEASVVKENSLGVDPETGDVTVGTCGEYKVTNPFNGVSDKYNKIEIDETTIDNELTLKFLMLHELGHCWFGLNHLNQTDEVMSPNLPQWNVLQDDSERILANMLEDIRNR